MRAASTAWMVSGMRRVAWSLPCSPTARASSSRKNGLPAALPTIACCRWSGRCSALRHRLHEHQAVVGGQPWQGELRRIRLRQPGGAIAGSVGHQQEDRRPGQPLHQRGQPLLRGGVDPVQVLHRQDERLPPTAAQADLLQGWQTSAP